MEAVEFIRTIQKMCTRRHCVDCPLSENYRCNVCYTDNPVKTVRIVEEWAAEQEQQKAEQDRQKAEQDRQKAEQDRQKAELHDKTYALSEKVDHTPTEEPSQTPEPKRTNKDVLLATFPDVRMDSNGIPRVCPRELYEHYHCSNWMWGCSVCRCAYWLAETEK